jgi:hypothetical protein
MKQAYFAAAESFERALPSFKAGVPFANRSLSNVVLTPPVVVALP